MMNADWLARENRKLKDEALSLKNKLQCQQEDESTHKQLFQRLKESNHKLQQDLRHLRQKLETQKQHYEQREKQYDFVIRKIEEELVEKTEQYEKLSNKITPLLDTDTVRLKVLNEVEYPHRLELEERELEIGRLKEEVFAGKRKVEQLLTRMQTSSLEYDRSIRDLKARHKIELDNAKLDIESLKVSEAVKSSHHEMESLLKQDVSYYKGCHLRSEQALQVLRQEVQKSKDQEDSQLRELVKKVGELQKQNSYLKDMSSLRPD